MSDDTLGIKLSKWEFEQFSLNRIMIDVFCKITFKIIMIKKLILVDKSLPLISITLYN